MPFPSDVLLPVNAKYHGFVQVDRPMNLNSDVTWSFTFALTGTQHGFCSFLTTANSPLQPGIPGQYMGYLGDGTIPRAGIFAVGFDTTGLFALSSSLNDGVVKSQIVPNSLIIRDYSNKVIFNSPLSSLSTEFILTSSTKVFQTLRFRVTNGGKKLYIDFKNTNSSYIPLANVALSGYSLNNDTYVYAGLAFTTPVSSSNSEISTMFLTNFNSEGSTDLPSIETIPMVSIYDEITSYTTIAGISAL